MGICDEKTRTSTDFQILLNRVKEAESRAVQAETRAIQIEEDMTNQLQKVIEEKFVAQERARHLQFEVEKCHRKISELEAEMELLRDFRQKTPPMGVEIVDMNCENMYWSPINAAQSPIVRNRHIDSEARVDSETSLDLKRSEEKQKKVINTDERAARAKTLFRDAILHDFVWSPSAFSMQDTPPSGTTSSTPRSFHWPIEYQSFVNPVHIDETKAIEQSSSLFESVDETRVQKVVANYFNHCHVPSPVSSLCSKC